MKLKGIPTLVLLAALTLRSTRTDPGSEEELKALARSWQANPIHPIIVRASDMAVGDGNRRVIGLLLLGVTEAEVELVEGEISDLDLDRMAMLSAYHRSPLGGYDQACIVRSMKEGSPGVSNSGLAEELSLDPSMPTRLLSLFDCLPEVQEAAKAGKIGVTHWYAIRRSPDQLAALAAALNGSSRDALEQDRKRRTNGHGKAATVKTTSIIVVLKSGITVTFKAEGITLAKALDAQAEVKQELKAAVEDGDHDARTFNVLMKKRAKELTRDAPGAGQAPDTPAA